MGVNRTRSNNFHLTEVSYSWSLIQVHLKKLELVVQKILYIPDSLFANCNASSVLLFWELWPSKKNKIKIGVSFYLNKS